MKKIRELKLGRLCKSEIAERDLKRLQGGNYCAYGQDNNYANTGGGLCSSGPSGEPASFLKNTTGWGQYC